VLDPSGVFDLEYSALKMLTEGEKRQREASVMLWLSTRGILRRTGTGPTSVVYYWRVSDPMGLTARV
jgi:hypothetical protein